MPRAVLVLTGSELVRGDLQDANGAFLARELTRAGLEPERFVVVGDRPERLATVLAEALDADLCVVSGGLGPTHDDRTVELLAAAAGTELFIDSGLEQEIGDISRRIAERLGRPYADFVAGVAKQASLPRGGVSLGLAGTAPAVLLARDKKVAVALPGPPAELRRLWPRVLEHEAVRTVLARARPRRHRLLRFYGPSESAVARALAEAGGEREGLEVTVCARDLEIHVDLYGDGDDVAARLREAFPDALFAEDDERSVAELVLARARRLGLTIAAAESCTGGLVAARLTDPPGASDVFRGGVVAYANDVKLERLGVEEGVLTAHGAVSAEAAATMAAGARRELRADVAVAVTGVAGPGGGTQAKPVGLVHLAVASPEASEGQRVRLSGDREAIRARAAALALHLLRRHLGTIGDTSA